MEMNNSVDLKYSRVIKHQLDDIHLLPVESMYFIADQRVKRVEKKFQTKWPAIYFYL